MKLIIRQVTQSWELLLCKQIVETAWPYDGIINNAPSSAYDLLQTKGLYIFIGLENNSMPICTASLYILPTFRGDFFSFAQIENVVVHPHHRGKDYGRQIIKHLVKFAENQYKIILNCTDENVIFYEKCGFVRKGNQMVWKS